MSTTLPPAVLKPRPPLSRSPRRPAAVTPAAPAPLSPARRRVEAVKNAAEYPVAVVLFLLLAPVMGAAILATRLSSRGPGLYRQRRVGRAEKVFTILKIRTMSHECESLTGPRWAITGDPRITPLGAVFRKLHVDELPQLVNVLRGEMSLVGPRPERPEIVAQLAQSVPGYHARHLVRPGITGYAQVHLPPDTNLQSVRNKVAYDRFYIRRMGAGMDLYVYLCTMLKVVGLKRVYRRMPRKPTAEV